MDFFTKIFNFIWFDHITPKKAMKSQLDVCGAPTMIPGSRGISSPIKE